MIPIDELSYGLKQRMNKLTTNEHQEIPPEDQVLALIEAQNKLVKIKIGDNNPSRMGLDGFKKRYQDLQFLVENPEDHALKLKLSDKFLNKWLIDITPVKPEFMFYLDSYMIADKGRCKNRILYSDSELVKHTDITTILRNTNMAPSFEYQVVITDISSDELHYYTDGTFTPKKVYLSYLRYPKKVDMEGYVHFDGSDSTTVDCELEAYLKDELLDLAVESLAMYTENNSAAQNAKQRQQENE